MTTQQIVMADREVNLDELRQQRVYAGLLEGMPTASCNRRRADRLMAEAKAMAYEGAVHLIESAQTPIPYEGRYPFGAPMRLPEISVIARLRSYSVARDADGATASSLVVVWFQDAFALPVASEIEAHL